ncbi:glycine/D-amino acid oxidase-like deaminating enzyme [Crossiella equi]|uniref:Glycine/D-amino acid oxidase-like deaminating enzyme n=1 Tax=Crossiella equi TaxID=130796 RepID=A0ABS5ALX2_9PSEU|nr:FAD-dependent oxidoreductase [Crossiella equi]MBP2477219.1 glycine/D-amino acid oxidase-like deaminating enzyme [Crossiella equi]
MLSDDVHARSIAVLGAGASGLAAARELHRLGHRVVVLEARTSVGGQCASAEVDGYEHDLAAHTYSPAHHRVQALVEQLGLTTHELGPPLALDPATGQSRPVLPAPMCHEALARYRRVREELFPRIAEPGLAHSARALATPARRWLTEFRLTALGEALGTAGFGHLHLDLPALYLVKYAELMVHQEYAGCIRAVCGGFGALWRRVAEELPDVRLGARVDGVRRERDGVRLLVDGEPLLVEDLVVATGLPEVLPVLDATEAERALAARVRHLDLVTTLATVRGLPEGAQTVVPGGTGGCVGFQRHHPDSDVLACHAYGGPGLDGPAIADRLRADVASWGGRLERLHLQRRWRTLPHFGSEDLAGGALDELEALQGQRRTYHLGALGAFELVECVLGYAQDLVRRHFAPARTRTGSGTVAAARC